MDTLFQSEAQSMISADESTKEPKPVNTEQSFNSTHLEESEKSYLCHYANYCRDYSELTEIFNLQFRQSRSLKSIESFLEESKRNNHELFQKLSTRAEEYKWYIHHPSKPPVPSVVLGTPTWSAEMRCFLLVNVAKGIKNAELTQ